MPYKSNRSFYLRIHINTASVLFFQSFFQKRCQSRSFEKGLVSASFTARIKLREKEAEGAPAEAGGRSSQCPRTGNAGARSEGTAANTLRWEEITKDGAAI